MDFGDFEAVEQQVRDLAAMGLYMVRIVSDPAFMWLALNRLKAEGFPVETMTQDHGHMCGVAGNLHKLLSGGKLVFDAPEIIADLSNVKVEERPPWGWRMGKLDDDEYIDCAIAGGMASFVLESEFMYSGPPIIVG
jgi:phage terminase large subunit-like protein